MPKSLNYLNKNFQEFNDTLIQYIKDRFPNEYTDITNANPGQIFIGQGAYDGSVLSFYLDNQLQNLLPQYTNDIKSLLAYAYIQGYPVLPTTTATVEITIQQIVPAKMVSGEYIPDLNYTIIIPSNTVVSSTSSSSTFLTERLVDFSFVSPDDPTETRIFSYDSNNNPENYALSKKVKAIAGTKKEFKYQFNEPQKFATIEISDTNILYIQSAIDEQGNVWYEVPYLGQNTIFKAAKNTYEDNDVVKNVIGIEKVAKRFVSRFKNSNLVEIEFGAGIFETSDTRFIPTLDAIKNYNDSYVNTYNPINPNSFLYTKEYGEAPHNTEITFTYITGGGTQANIPSNSITNINTTDITFNGMVDQQLSTFILQNLSVTNKDSATGGRNALTLKEIRNVLIANFGAQDRAINKEDYAVRCLSLPSKFGVVAKSYVQKGDAASNIVQISGLGYDRDGKYTALSPTLKQNLHNYLETYKSINDKPIITDAYIINFGLEFEITVYENHTPKDVILRCITRLKEYFANSNWQINQPIIKSDILYTLSILEGVQSVISVNIVNKSGGNYSPIVYDMALATRNNVIYPSIDPSIFEIKFPETDIVGRVKLI